MLLATGKHYHLARGVGDTAAASGTIVTPGSAQAVKEAAPATNRSPSSDTVATAVPTLIDASQTCARLGDGVHELDGATYTCTPTSFSVYRHF